MRRDWFLLITIDTKAYILRMFVSNFYFCFLFFSFYDIQNKKKKLLYLIVVVFVTFFLDIFISFSDFFPIVFGYYLFKKKNKKNYILLNALIYSTLIGYICALVSFYLTMNIFPGDGTKGFLFVITQLIIRFTTVISIIILSKKFDFRKWNETTSSYLTYILLLYVLGVAVLISFAADYFDVFEQFIVGFISFFIVQTLFLIFTITFILDKQKKDLTKKFNDQELINLKKYTDMLEKKQEDLDRFKHDYKNILLSFKTKTKDNSPELYEQILQLESYSNQHMKNSSKKYMLFQNIQNPYLKSLIIAKINETMDLGLSVNFECSTEIKQIPINLFDALRIIGILLDNAIESAHESYKKSLSLMIYKDDSQIEFVIQNSCREENLELNNLQNKYFSSKENHSGLGLYTVHELNKKYPNMFFNFKMESKNFITQLILTY